MVTPWGGLAPRVGMLITFDMTYQKMNNAEKVRQFQPWVALWQPRAQKRHEEIIQNPERVARFAVC
jgi:hypothetical protein